MHKKLKIAIYSGQIPSTTFIESLITGVSEHHDVLLFGSQPKVISYSNKNIKVYKIPDNNWHKLAYNLWRTLQLLVQRPKELVALYKEVKTYKTAYHQWQNYSKLLPMVLNQPDILHIQWAKNLQNLMVLKTVFNIPIVLSLRGSQINYSPIISKELAISYSKNFPKVDAFHAVSKAIGLEAEKYGASTEKIKVIYSILPKLFLDAYQPLQSKTGSTINILSVGRPHWIKGYTYAIESMAELKNRGYSVQYQIIGIDKPDEELLFLIAEFGLSQNVVLQPKMSQTKLMALMQTQDIMLLSSLEEGIANVVLESMAIGLPVISTNCGGMSEVVIPGKTGLLVPVRDGKAIAQAVIDMRNMPLQELQNQSNNAHELIKSKFNMHENVSQFLELYRSVRT
ncbi:MAG: glycosyltransferase family 4 protein [Gelidibacter sp.]